MCNNTYNEHLVLSEALEDFDDERFGKACRAVFAKYRVRKTLYEDVVRYFNEVDHAAWYWRLIADSELDSILARELTQAMHADTGCYFDYDLCIAVPST